MTLPPEDGPDSFRDQMLLRLADLPQPDVLILGGGVNGIGALRDLALNGVSVALIDTHDFCAGASSASSRMAHGGLRYLEGREFRLVGEAAQERNRLIRHARHLVRPLSFLVPVTGLVSGFGRSVLRFLGVGCTAGPLSLASLEGALGLYEFLGRGPDALPRHKVTLSRSRFPKGLTHRARALVSFYDGQITNPEGLMLEMLDEALGQGAQVAALNHADWTFEDGTFSVVGHNIQIRPKVILNATGSAIDKVNAHLGRQTQYLRGVKGAHLLIDHPDLADRLNDRAFYFDDGNGRMVLALPVGTNVLVGTTEVDVSDPNDRSVSDQEVEYLLAAINSLFDDLSIQTKNIVSVTSGIRPLRRDDSGTITAASRDHALELDRFEGLEAPVLSLVGGKWTTFRAFAEQATDLALAQLQHPRQLSTADRDYPGAKPCTAEQVRADAGCSVERATDLIGRYGAIAREVAVYCAGHEDDRPLAGAKTYSRAEIEWLVHVRGAWTVEDILLRRTRLTQGAGIADSTVHDVGSIILKATGRAEADINAEVAAALTDPRIVGARVIGQKAA